MPDFRERVVLREQSDGRTVGGTDSRTKCGLETADAALDPVAGPLEHCADRGHGMTLLVGELGVRVDVPLDRREDSGVRDGEPRNDVVDRLTPPSPSFTRDEG